MFTLFLIIFLIALVVFLFRITIFNYKFKLDNFTFFEGSLGSGKTTIITKLAISEFKHRKRYNLFRKPLTLLILITPIFNIFYLLKFVTNKEKTQFYKVNDINFKESSIWLPYRNTDVYSNYPILLCYRFKFIRFNKIFKLVRVPIYSYIANLDILTWKFRVNDDCIIVLDEVGYLFPSEQKKTDPRITFCLTWLRHATNCLCFCASQSISECNVTFRRKINHCYLLKGLKGFIVKKFPLQRTEITEMIVSEEITQNVNIEKMAQKDYWFIYPRSRFASRYAKKLYKLSDDDINKLSYNYNCLFDYYSYKNGERWSSLYYE